MIFQIQLLVLVLQVNGLEMKEMSSLYQFSSEKVDLSKMIENEEQLSYGYGIWTRYNPLSTISQVGVVNLFDSDCYNIHNVVDQETQSLNLIYYDCLDYPLQKIKKIIQFIDNEGKEQRFELSLDGFEYENVWFYLELLQWPRLKRFQLMIIQQDKAKLKSSLEIQHPFNDLRVILNFGGGLTVQKSLISSIKIGQLFSYFPGKMIQSKFAFKIQSPDLDFEAIAIDAIQPYTNCLCINSQIFSISDFDLKVMDQKAFLPEQVNCDSFTLSGWFKITEVIQESVGFIYQFLKLASNYEGQLSDPNLSPFQLLYKISPNGNQIITTTYSYNFPLVTINFEENPFLITNSFDIENLLNFWHFVNVQLIGRNFQILIKSYKEDKFIEFQVHNEVMQFNNLQLKLNIGNIEQNQLDYLNVQSRNLVLYNCPQTINQNYCHYSCEICDGPTKFDCLSCSIESQRIYLSQFKVCICPYHTVDEKICKQYQDYQLSIIDGDDQNNKRCQYGYYEYSGDCLKCPSIIKDNILYCIECLQNPKTWSTKPNCLFDLVLNANGDTQQKIYQYSLNFLFDGENLNYCEFFCNESQSFVADEHNIELEIENYIIQQQDCGDRESLCSFCVLSVSNRACIRCHQGYTLIDQKCIRNIEDQITCGYQKYLTSRRQCQTCHLKNCKYCFEYQNDLRKCTLYKEFENFYYDEEIKIGCAMCEKNYIFDFTQEKCILKQPSNQNCLRAYLDFNGNEICTFAALDDFNIAPEIVNCEKYQPQCLSCIRSPQFLIKCIVCKIGYTASIINGGCYLTKKQNINSLITIEGDYSLQDAWIQRIQAFTMKFLPNSYFYPHTFLSDLTEEFSMECIDGYQLNSISQCSKSCSSECLSCVEDKFQESFCNKCPLSQYYQPIRNQYQGKCLECPQLCQICETRSDIDIYNLQPTFIIKDDNLAYTTLCLKPINDPNVYLDQNDLIAKNCLNNINCNPTILWINNFENCEAEYEKWDLWETNININYCNTMGIDKIIIRFNFLNSDIPTCFLENILIKNTLKSQIFSLRKLTFQFTSDIELQLITDYHILIHNFDVFDIKNVTFISSKYTNIIIKNNNQSVDLNLFNFSIAHSIIQNTSSIFQTDIFGNIQIKHLVIVNSTFLNSSFFNFEKFPITGNIQIDNLIIQNCTINQSSLFIFKLTKGTIYINNLVFEESNIYHSRIFIFNTKIQNQTHVNFTNFNIKNNTFYNSQFQNSNSSLYQSLMNIKLQENIFQYSNIFDFYHNISMSKIIIVGNYFQYSSLFFTQETQFEFKLSNSLNFFQAENNRFTSSNIWRIQSSLETSNLILSLQDLFIEDVNSINQIDYLFKFKCFQLSLNTIQIKNLTNIFIFYIYQSNYVNIQNVLLEGIQNQYKVPLSQTCQSVPQLQIKLFKIMGFRSLKIIKIRIQEIFNIDESIIDINSNNEEYNTESNFVQMHDIQFLRNLMILQNQIEFTSLLKINSEKKLNVSLNEIQYLENIFHSLTDNSFKNYASLLFVNCKTCSVKIANYISKFNLFSNSSSSFVQIISKFISFNNYHVENHNLLPLNLLIKYVDLQLDNDYNQDEINQIIQQALSIKNIGGAAQLTTSNFRCFDCTFSRMKASKSSVFEIITEQDGIIELVEFKIYQAEHDLQQMTNSSGCIAIYSQNSLLNLKIVNSYFSQIISRLAPSILTITPSITQNQIVITNITIINCLSLLNSILKVQFSNKIIQQNNIRIANVKILINEENWINYFSKIEALTNSEIEEVTSETNAMIYFESCQIDIKELQISGLLLYPILKVSNIPSLKLQNFWIDQIYMFYSFNIIDVQQTVQTKFIVIFSQFSITNTNPYLALETQLLISQILFINQNCTKITISTVEKSQTFMNVQNSFKRNAKNSSSLINLKSIQEKNNYRFNLIQIKRNNCTFCSNGLIYFNIYKIEKLSIYDLNCFYNIISDYGCLNFVHATQISQSYIKVINSKIINNTGNKGAAITSIEAPIIVSNCIIMNNIANEQGGGLYFDLKNKSFVIKSTIIIQNKANIGGGLYLDGNQTINVNNFIQSLLILNQAKIYGNNLIESPSNLALIINLVEMRSSKFILNNTQTNILQIKPYTTIEEEQKIKSDYLKIPSNQVIRDYQLFIPKISRTLILFQDLSLYFKNSRNEFLFNQMNSTCIVSQQIIENDKILNNTQLSEIAYNSILNGFDMNILQFHFNPNSQDKSYLQIIIQCEPIDHSKQLQYIINARSYKCQLGEFQVDNGCQLCQSNQGYYSVTYNDTKCSIFDKQKFQSITANQLNLNEGYWRPNYFSDYTTQCFKNMKNCKGGWYVGDQLCIKGHLGALCEECDIYNIQGDGKYFKNSENSECLSCFGISDSIVPFVLNSVWAVLSVIVTLNSINKSNDLFVLLRIKEKQSQIIFKLTQDFESIFIKMMLNYFWIFSLIFTFNISFSFSFNFIDKASNTSYSMANNLDCHLSDITVTQLIYLKVFVILILIIWQFLMILLIFYIYCQLSKNQFKIRIVSNILLCLYILNYQGLIKLLASIISLREISNYQYIQGDVSLIYDTESHFQWILFFMVPFLVVFGGFIPLLLFLLIVLNKDKIYKGIGQLRVHLCYLFNEYEKERYYWEEIKLFKKAVMILILTYFETNIFIKASLLGLCLLFYQLLLVKNRPYIISKLNHLDLQSGQICSISIFLATTKYFSEQQNNYFISLILQIILTFFFIILSYPFIISILRIYYKKYKVLFLTFLELLMKKIKLKSLQKDVSEQLRQEENKQIKLKLNLQKLRKYLIIISKAQIQNRSYHFIIFFQICNVKKNQKKYSIECSKL
ncbi:unnamed protein product [Paramecium sonneborni]|uniref:Transmembrane protein n=1 Tax=Paramecium sonneborni TaxID=65129 RepID=A0A8S1RHF2_9CILI|nr:unnamed protein product [Paramecium sonneborni]